MNHTRHYLAALPALLIPFAAIATTPATTPAGATSKTPAVSTTPAATPARPAAAPGATPPPAAGSAADLAARIWVLSGGDKTLSQIKAGLSSGEGHLSVAIDKPMADKITEVLNQALDPVPVLYQDYIAKNGKTDQLASIVKWLESPFGKKVREAEAKAPPLQYHELERTIPLKEPKFSKEREVLYKRYEKIAYETNYKFISETSDFYMVVNNGIKPPTERTAAKDMEQALKLNRVKMSELTRQLLPHLFASTYREMIVDELKIYIDFLESEPGRAYLNLNTDAYVNALQKTRPDVLLKLAGIFEDELAVLSPYSKEVLSDARQKQLMTTMLKRFGKPPLIGAILEIRGGQMTIVRNGVEQEVYGRPNQDFVTVDTLMKDMRKARYDLRRYYQVVQKRVQMGQ